MPATCRSGTGGSHGRRTLALLVPLVAILVGAGCSGEVDLGGQAAARITAGRGIEVAAGDGWVAVEVDDEVPAGARVRTGTEDAHVAFRSGQVRLAPQAAAVVDDNAIQLVRGEALVASDGDLATQWNEVEVTGKGVYRLSPGIAPRLGVYRGQVQVRRGPEVRTVPALREASLSSRRMPASGQPLAYRSDDPWDQMLLPDAIAFDNEAERYARGLAAQYGTEPRPEAFYTRFALAPERTVPALSRGDGRIGPPGEALLRLFLAHSAATGRETPDVLETMVHEVVELRSVGARWGLIATELGVTTQRLAEVVNAGQARYAAAVGQRPTASAPTAPPASPRPPHRDADGSASGPSRLPPRTEPAPPPPGPSSPEPASGPASVAEGPVPEPEPEPQPQPRSDAASRSESESDPDDATGTAPPRQPQPQPNPTDMLLGRERSPGLVETVVNLLIGGS